MSVIALNKYGISSQIFFGQAAWIEVTEKAGVLWAGCWDGNVHLWVATEFGEIVDLNVGVAHRKRAHQSELEKSKYSPPLLWSTEVPKFYRYQPEGVAEIDLTEERDIRWRKLLEEEIDRAGAPDENLTFPNEPMLCPGRKLLDDSKGSFKHFDRALSVIGIPKAPF